jgi:hypothetical protein
MEEYIAGLQIHCSPFLSQRGTGSFGAGAGGAVTRGSISGKGTATYSETTTTNIQRVEGTTGFVDEGEVYAVRHELFGSGHELLLKEKDEMIFSLRTEIIELQNLRVSEQLHARAMSERLALLEKEALNYRTINEHTLKEIEVWRERYSTLEKALELKATVQRTELEMQYKNRVVRKFLFA